MPTSRDRPSPPAREPPASGATRRVAPASASKRADASPTGSPPAAPPAAAPGRAPPTTADPRAARAVACTWCNAPTQVAPSAKSVVCPHCNKRLVIEDFHTASYHAVRLVATCGDVSVDKRGHLVAGVRAMNVEVEGKLTGNVVAGGRVTVGKGAAVKGDIEAEVLRVESGASVSGFLRIGRRAEG